MENPKKNFDTLVAMSSLKKLEKALKKAIKEDYIHEFMDTLMKDDGVFEDAMEILDKLGFNFEDIVEKKILKTGRSLTI